MSKNIRLSEKHGLNPTMGICWWCGEPDGTLGLVGRLPNDAEAPRYAVLTQAPCPKCSAQMQKGITLLEADDEGKVTGAWAVVKEDFARLLFEGEGEEAVRQVVEKRGARIDHKIWKLLFQKPEGGVQ